TVDVTSIEAVAEAAENGFVRIPWDTVGLEGEARLANDALTVRCLQRSDGSLPEADDEPDLVALVARSY
ncbi:MAG: proline--tRNA ligase, partial [Acidimicrobiales bacterium]